jgi:hypothetical protein
MEARNQKTCRYCKHWGNSFCPYYYSAITRGIDDSACGQFSILTNVSMFKDRKKINQYESIKNEEQKKLNSLTRSIEF